MFTAIKITPKLILTSNSKINKNDCLIKPIVKTIPQKTPTENSAEDDFHIYRLPKKKETTATTMIAPIIEGMTAIPPIAGPQLPKSACPSEEPTRPAITLKIMPIDSPLLAIAPAIAPITPPTMIVHNQPIVNLSFLFYFLIKSIKASKLCEKSSVSECSYFFKSFPLAAIFFGSFSVVY